jgi:TonB family protein
MRSKLLFFLAGVFLCSSASVAQYQQELSRDLVRHTFILRNFYIDAKLRFDTTGALISPGTPGFGPTDGRVYVKEVELGPNQLTIRGERPISIFDPGTGDTTLLGLHRKVEIDLQLPPDKPADQSVEPLLDRIFFTSSEADAFTCSADEEKAFRERMLRSKAFISAKKDDGGGNNSGGQPRQLCYPGGTRAYIAGGGIDAPKPLKTPDPNNPIGVSAGHTNKIVVLAVVVDVTGKCSSMVVIGPGATVFDVAAIEAVKRWKFVPASYQGKPVAAAINVEVTFAVR